MRGLRARSEQWCIRNHIPINLTIAQNRLLPLPASGAVPQHFGARQPGAEDVTVPSLSQGSEDVISANPEISKQISTVND
jgi:hypothetical protein